ncbi:MAG: HU family DNA-binding protein [Candidatus Nanohaloarchaea archaeon]|nr:HU family DNA-binding protein [Candidatus Nanohaloarchaea archaeon]
MKLHKEDVLKEIAEEADLSVEKTEEVINQFIARTRNSLRGGKQVEIPGLGKLYTAKRRVTPLKKRTIIKFEADRELMQES